jgi:hypothetical protein
VLVIKRIHVTYHLKAPADKRDAAERAHDVHANACPVYRSIYKAIDVTTELDLVETSAARQTGQGYRQPGVGDRAGRC